MSFFVRGMSFFVRATTLAVLLLGLAACRSESYAGLSKKEARQQGDLAIEIQGPHGLRLRELR
jgi:hypothetical protein